MDLRILLARLTWDYLFICSGRFEEASEWTAGVLKVTLFKAPPSFICLPRTLVITSSRNLFPPQVQPQYKYSNTGQYSPFCTCATNNAPNKS